jgi:hypothetical protein
MASETPAWLPSAAHAPGLAGLRVRISRSGRDRQANVVTSSQRNWLEAGRPLIHVTAQASDASLPNGGPEYRQRLITTAKRGQVHQSR